MSRGVSPQPGGPSPAFLGALRRLLRPLVRVLIAQGVTFPALGKLLKEVYVDVAERDFPVAGRPQSDSRISLLTGVHRKDIKALRERDAGLAPASPLVSRNAKMLVVWTGDPAYLDERGRPRALPRHAAEGPSFERLAESISKDIRARAVLDEWLRLGLVRLEDDDLVVLNSEAFVPREDFEDLAFYFGRNLHDHIAAAGRNLLGEKPPRLERAVYYDKLTPATVEALAALSREIGQDALLRFNRKAYELAEADEGKPDAEGRMSFGLYFHGEADEPSEPPKDGSEPGGGDDEPQTSHD